MRSMRWLACVLVLSPIASSPGQEEAPVEIARKKLQVAPGLKATLWASDPDLQNPVAISIDEKGRIYVAECHRRHTSTLDIHMRKEWLDDDLACRRHEDQVAYHERRLGERAKEWMVESERIRILEDRSNSGRADTAVTFCDGFNHLCEGIGAGILVRNGEVWYACIPNLWYLKDSGAGGKADIRRPLLSGFGVHLGASGHDMHGLRFGPDGKLYWSHGDRGFHVESEGKVIDFPDSGGVLRSNPDGSELELVCTGLRNPQELQFDDFGNLFTGDNNISIAPDVGETCRWTYVVEGADYGWRIGYQFMPRGGAWCEEEQWRLEAGFQIPCVARLGHGPSGVTVHPGVAAIPDRYRNHFFMCDYPGGIWSFEMKPKGAFFEMIDLDKLMWEIQAPDVEFGPDGALYVADWVGMWDKVDKGRIWRLADPNRLNDPLVLEVKRLISEGMSSRSVLELGRLLGHTDQRIRQAAQFELVRRKDSRTLEAACGPDRPRLARLHAIWGLGQLKTKEVLLPLLDDADMEVRAQAAKTLGGLRTVLAYPGLTARLKDESPRVRFFAAMGLGKIGKRDAAPAIIEFLRANGGQDRMLQHAGIMALSWLDDLEAILGAGRDSSTAVRMAALVALRKLRRPEAGIFLRDSDPKIVLEAARAIYDLPIPKAFPELVGLLRGSGPERALLRSVNAAFRLGDAEALATFAANEAAPLGARVEALQLLGEWEHPPGRDRLMGLWRPVPARPKSEAIEALTGRMGKLLQSRFPGVVEEAARLSGALGIVGSASVLKDSFRNLERPGAGRAAALRALAALKGESLLDLVRQAVRDGDEAVVCEGVRLLAELHPPDAPTTLLNLVRTGNSTRIRQQAILALGTAGADGALGELLDGGVPGQLLLDLLEAAQHRPTLRERLARIEGARRQEDPLSPYREALEGGDAESGRRIFFDRNDVQCIRCHTIGTQGGQIGPPLTTIGSQKTREYLLESIVFPNRQIAEGWGQVAIQLKSEEIEVGRVEKESKASVTLILPDGQKKVIRNEQIKARKAALSAMPEDLVKHLSKRDLRDLVEFLARQQ